MGIRVGVIGPGRTREGLGPFIIKYLIRHGAELVAVAASSAESAQLATRQIAQQYGVQPRGYESAGQMLRRARVDALVICSPTPLHLQHLQLAAACGVHVLCAKPLFFDGQHPPAPAVRGTLRTLQKRGYVVMVNHPWPFTLPVFEKVYPGIYQPGVSPADLQVWLSPSCSGKQMLPHSLTHALSLLLAVTSWGGQVLHLQVDSIPADSPWAPGWDVAFVYVHRGGSTVFRVRLSQAREQPRRAGYAINGRWMRRRVQWPQYRIYFEPGHPEQAPASYDSQACPQAILAPDPLELLVQRFLQRCQEGPLTDEEYYLMLTPLAMLWMVWSAVGQKEAEVCSPRPTGPPPELAKERIPDPSARSSSWQSPATRSTDGQHS